MRALLIAASLVLVELPAQETPPSPKTPAPEKKPAPKSPVSKLRERMLKDLEKVAKSVDEQPHAFKGTIRCQSQEEIGNDEWEFVGACDKNYEWFTIDDWRVVSSSLERVVVSNDEAPWGKPQGDSPDVPLTPRLICKHMPTAELSRPEPAEFEGRPAILVRARWTGKAAMRVVRAAACPSSNHEQVLDMLAASARKNRKNVSVDGCMRYDPATGQWLATTLRFAYTDGQELPENRLPPEAPEGLPELTSWPLMEYWWQLRRCEPKTLPLPALDDKAKKLLRKPAKTAPGK